MSIKILILMRLPEVPVTGGEIYNFELRNYLGKKFTYFKNISWQHKPCTGTLMFIVNALLQNLSLLKYWRQIESDTVILEDISQSSDLFLFNILVRVLKKLTGKRIHLLTIVQQIYYPLMNGSLRRMLTFIEEAIFINTSDGIIANSEFTKSLVEDALMRNVKIVVAYPGLNVSGLSGSHLREVPLRKSDGGLFHLLFVGVVKSRKGVDTLIRAFEILVNDECMERLILHVVGDIEREGSFYQELRDFSEKRGLGDKIIFHGRIEGQELKFLYMTSDLFVFPSLGESFGMVLAEAASFGLPIVTTDVGAIPYLIKDGINGILVSPKDPKKLAIAIKRLLQSPELMSKFGEANKELAAQFDWDKSFSKVADLVDDLSST
jgi:glycosyltransferase involved in cell wall biosynthesis